MNTPLRQVPVTTSQLDFRTRIGFMLAAVPEVQAVFTSELGKILFVWAIVPNRDSSVYRRLYEKEKEIIQSNDDILFDFTIMASRGQDPRAIITDPTARLAYLRS